MKQITDGGIFYVLLGLFSTAFAIDCYVCTSINGENKDCEDKFDPTLKTYHLIKRNCMYGFFRGTHCIKLTGERDDGTSILVRHCSDVDWGRHCGDIRYEYGDVTEKISGCLESCAHDGCNGTENLNTPLTFVLILSICLCAILR